MVVVDDPEPPSAVTDPTVLHGPKITTYQYGSSNENLRGRYREEPGSCDNDRVSRFRPLAARH